MCILNLQQSRHHTALPVVGMDHVRLEIQQGQSIQRTTAEKAEALVLVTAQAIDIGASEIVLVVHEVPGNAVLFQLFNAAVLPTPAQLHFKVAHMGHLFGPLGRNGGIQGQHDTHVMSLCGKHGGKSTHNVSQSAGFYKGDTFACRKQDLHFRLPPILRMLRSQRSWQSQSGRLPDR